MLIRTALPEDAAALCEIYKPYVLETEITFETVPPTTEEFASRIRNIEEHYPYVVCEDNGIVLGYAYASRQGERAAYEYSVSMSVYVRQGYHRQGVARAMYNAILPELQRRGFRIATATISMPNEPSAAFHSSFGFKRIGVYRSMGYKHGKWIDQLLMEKPLYDADIPDRVKFTKMHGCGNDYIFIDCMNGSDVDKSVIESFCERRFGIGADGVVFVCLSDIADAKMIMFNSDGSEGLMCGNAIRCVAKLLVDCGYAAEGRITVETKSGVKTLETGNRNGRSMTVTVDMGRIELMPYSTDRLGNRIYPVSVGNPHCVIFCSNLESLKLDEAGKEYALQFPGGANIEFVKILDGNSLRMRVWERGSGETLSCGTGACASAAVAAACGYCSTGTTVRVLTDGGELDVLVKDNSAFLTGEAVTVFEGEALV